MQWLSRCRLLAPSLALLVVPAACAGGRPGPGILTPVATPAPRDATQVRVYVATTRMRDAANIYTTAQAPGVNYASFGISLPPGHRVGEIEWPGAKPDPRKSFAVTTQQVLGEDAFYAAISREASGRELGVFIHGYNTTFQEGVFRLAQMSADSHIDGVPVLFAWPSHASISGYVADSESVTGSRDALTATLNRLVARRGSSGNVTVFAHSMGGWLLMESLRQLKLGGRDDVLSRLEVFLASPDIDEHVFLSQLATIGRMRHPITVFVSGDDLALRASAIIAGADRVGLLNVAAPGLQAELREAGVRVTDISELSARDRLRHDRYAELATGLPEARASQPAPGGTAGTLASRLGGSVAAAFWNW